MAKHPLRLGYKASAEQFGPRELLDFTTEAEERGFDSAWISDHFQPWRYHNGHAPFALSWLGSAGERTKRGIPGARRFAPPFCYQPALGAHGVLKIGGPVPGSLLPCVVVRGGT